MGMKLLSNCLANAFPQADNRVLKAKRFGEEDRKNGNNR